MGLDMYLERDNYISNPYKRGSVTGTIDLTRETGETVELDLDKIGCITESVGRWRKANQIHGWFVDNCQDGQDDCGRHEVSYSQLLELKKLCLEVLDSRDWTLLPPKEGLFFGSGEIDDYYWKDIEDTVNIIDGLGPKKAHAYYFYESSW